MEAALFIELSVGDIRVGEEVRIGGDGVLLTPAGEALPSPYPESVLIISSAAGRTGSGFWAGLKFPLELVLICSDDRTKTGDGIDVLIE